MQRIADSVERIGKATIERLLNWPLLPAGNPANDRHPAPKAYVDAEIAAIPQVETVRQSIIHGARDANGLPVFLTPGSANSVNVEGSPTPLIVTVAKGFSATGQADQRLIQAADTSVTGLSTSLTSYIYAEDNAGVPAFGVSNLQPVIQATAPTSPTTDQHWFDTRNAQMKRWDGAAWENKNRVFIGCATPDILNALLHCNGTDGATTVTDVHSGVSWTLANGAQLDTGNPKYGTASIQFDGVDDFIYSTSPAFDNAAQKVWELEHWFYIDPAQTAYAGLFSWGSSDVLWEASSGKLYVSGWNGISDGTLSSGTVSTGAWHHFKMNWDGTTYRIFIDGTATSLVWTGAAVASGANKMRLGISANESNWPLLGWIDDIRWSNGRVRDVANFTAPAAEHSDTDYTLFTSIVNYALGDFVDCGPTAYANNAPFSQAHNFGHLYYRPELYAVCQSTEAGYAAGEMVTGVLEYDGTGYFPPALWMSPEAAGFFVHSSGLYIGHKTTGVRTSMTPVNWKIGTRPRRLSHVS